MPDNQTDSSTSPDIELFLYDDGTVAGIFSDELLALMKDISADFAVRRATTCEFDGAIWQVDACPLTGRPEIVATDELRSNAIAEELKWLREHLSTRGVTFE